MFITDLDGYATARGITKVQAAGEMKRLCAQHNLEIVCLGSFDNFEGHPRRSLEERLRIAREWIAMADGLGTDVIQVPSNDDKDAVGDIDTIVANLQALADLGLRQESPDTARPLVVEHVARPNYGLCLDTYLVLARLWSDPRSPSGRRPGGDAALHMSLETFRARIPDSATAASSTTQAPIVYVQLSDAERLAPPILPGHATYSEHQDGVHSWCRYGRLFPLERARSAYLPVLDVARTWSKDSGWTGGWLSIDVFHRDMEREGSGPEHWAERGTRSWEELVKRLGEE
ncbi:uncharacterized protein Z519_06296 [Cladophialophora bantiana CBS 173.52]|uniref:Xylose isomerase-like TIM barrel domain-containing protein n=1 Tax=Cladophialophora bantiana (strain ATCC 10958 / CBS 173.52 / CDC B-1940 / NIH 8579) TaxID=1442370 RepID=A0A0D2I6I6_CLAB1|nr:uncharacterized protein Z519_06296 [Cladophialophora bantiana CBS 173.52]KIW92449.1 hypothetical protein Z519_06296 [Cladophialophora bantiana CBS 173.52]